jgi:hypothetical protein
VDTGDKQHPVTGGERQAECTTRSTARLATPPGSAVGAVEPARDLATRRTEQTSTPCKAIERANPPDSGRTGRCPRKTQRD